MRWRKEEQKEEEEVEEEEEEPEEERKHGGGVYGQRKSLHNNNNINDSCRMENMFIFGENEKKSKTKRAPRGQEKEGEKKNGHLRRRTELHTRTTTKDDERNDDGRNETRGSRIY